MPATLEPVGQYERAGRFRLRRPDHLAGELGELPGPVSVQGVFRGGSSLSLIPMLGKLADKRFGRGEGRSVDPAVDGADLSRRTQPGNRDSV